MLLNSRREHDHRKIFATPQLFQHFESIEDGEHHIEDHQIVCAILRRGEALAAIVGAIQLVIGLVKELAHHAA